MPSPSITAAPITSPRARILFLSDTHLGIDTVHRPRVVRRRRGDDFLANYERALAPAREGLVDLVIHGGDVFYRSQIDPDLVTTAFAPLMQIADRGIPVFVVPGNHERSAIPFPLLAAHQRIHVFRSPRTIPLVLNGLKLAISGFPNVRGDIRSTFPEVLERTQWRDHDADVRLLCMHQAIEGARVGPADFTFRDTDDVIRARDLPSGFAAVLSGHIHRAQRLTHDLNGHPMATPVLYPGSIERTSFAECEETKGFLLLEAIASPDRAGGEIVNARFRKLPARPMRHVRIDVQRVSLEGVVGRIRNALECVEPDAIVRLETDGEPANDVRMQLTSALVRRIAPPTMNIELANWRE